MDNPCPARKYDLEDRCLAFSKSVRMLIKKLPYTLSNREDGKQLLRSSASVGANYIEANEALGKKDFIYRIRICRKEAKESNYWLNLIDIGNQADLEPIRGRLIQESVELLKIFSSIMRKCTV